MARKDWKKLADTSVALLEKSFKNTTNNNDLGFTSPSNACTMGGVVRLSIVSAALLLASSCSTGDPGRTLRGER